MDTLTVCFFGHRRIDDSQVEDRVYEYVCDLIRRREYVVFLVGRNGDFDQIVSSVVRRAKKQVFASNSSLTLVLPYSSAEYRNNEDSFNEYYDDIIIANDESAHFKAAFRKRNQAMVDMADLCIFYVRHEQGGAYQTLKYAKAKKKAVIQL